jgi:hypothetical protein
VGNSVGKVTREFVQKGFHLPFFASLLLNIFVKTNVAAAPATNEAKWVVRVSAMVTEYQPGWKGGKGNTHCFHFRADVGIMLVICLTHLTKNRQIPSESGFSTPPAETGTRPQSRMDRRNATGGNERFPYFLHRQVTKEGRLLLLITKLRMIDLVGYSLSPNEHFANQKDSIDGALPAFPTLKDVARDFDATKDVQLAEFSIDDAGRFFNQEKKRVNWNFLGSDGQQHTVSLLWNKRSGEITVTMDDEEVWYGQRKGFSDISHMWETKEGMCMHLFASCQMDQHLDFAERRWSLTIRNTY